MVELNDLRELGKVIGLFIVAVVSWALLIWLQNKLGSWFSRTFFKRRKKKK